MAETIKEAPAWFLLFMVFGAGIIISLLFGALLWSIRSILARIEDDLRALFGKHDPRIVRINESSVEVVPEGNMLAVSNYDQPGVIGNLGTTLGNNQVNIARLNLSRDPEAKRAMVVLNTDSAVPEDILDKLRKLPHVISVKLIKM